MQQDMHFYGVYALARAAGIKDHAAETIAFASQFVDDAVDQGVVIVSGKNAVLPTMTSHKPVDFQNAIPNDQWQVWVPFHFLPGDEGSDFYTRMRCEKGLRFDGPAMTMLNASLDASRRDLCPHLAGITAHVFADTFSHYGFIGLCSDDNKVKTNTIRSQKGANHSAKIWKYVKDKLDKFLTRYEGRAAEMVPVGHGAVGTFPDRPFLKWEFEYEKGSETINRNNPEDYLKACELLHEYFARYRNANSEHADPSGQKQWAEISEPVWDLLTLEGVMKDRIDAWSKALSHGIFCKVTEKDKNISYKEDLWRPREGHSPANGNLLESDMCKFIRAANRHRDYVLRELLPSFGLIAV